MSETNEYNPYTAGVMALPSTGEPTRLSPVHPASDYNPYEAGVMGVTGSLEDRMTPRPVTATSYDQLPTKDTEGRARLPAVKRVRDAITGAWRDANVLAPEYQEKMNKAVDPWGNPWPGILNRNVINPALKTVAAVPAAIGAGVVGTVDELATGAGHPGVGRDLNAAIASLSPVMAGMAPVLPRTLTPGGMPRPGGAPGERPPVGTGPSGPLNQEALAEALRRRAERNDTMSGGMPTPGPEGPASTATLPYTVRSTALGVPDAEARVPIAERLPPPPGYIPPSSATGLASDAFDVARAHYDLADHYGGRVSAKANDAFLDNKIAGIRTQTPEARRFDPTDAVDASIGDLNNALRGQELSLRGTQEIDKKIGDRIEVALRAGKNDEASRLLQMQHALRDHVESVGQGETVGGPAGFAALKDARKAWSIAVRMQDVERMIAKAQDTQNPQVTLRNAINRYANDEKTSRGWSKEDLDLLKASAKTSDGMEILRGMASRLGPIGGYAMGGPIGGLAGLATETVIANRARDALGGIYRKRLEGVNRQLSTHLPGTPGYEAGPPAPRSGVLPTVGLGLPQPSQRGLLGSMVLGTDPGELRRKAEERAQLEEQLRLRGIQ
jgi:hypothetical protein